VELGAKSRHCVSHAVSEMRAGLLAKALLAIHLGTRLIFLKKIGDSQSEFPFLSIR